MILGIGETDEALQTALDLRSAEVDVLTMGQYLQPTPRHMAVVKYITPEAFKWV
jgi:lipoic acid synthetase